MTAITIIIGALDTVTKGLVKRLEDLEIRGIVETLQTSIVEISQNTAKSPGDLRRLAVTQIPVKDQSANADVKNSQGLIIIIIIECCKRGQKEYKTGK